MLNLQQRDVTRYTNCSQIAVKCRLIPCQIRAPGNPFSSIDPWHSHEKTTCAYDGVNGVSLSFGDEFLRQLFRPLVPF
jgi:hypothetical protein